MNERQKRFCEEYIVDLNATQAAIRAGYSEKTANEQGARLLVNVSIQKYIEELQEERGKRLQVTQDDVIREISDIALLPLNDENVLTGIVKVKDKVKALELLGRHFGAFVDKVEQKTEISDGINVNIEIAK